MFETNWFASVLTLSRVLSLEYYLCQNKTKQKQKTNKQTNKQKKHELQQTNRLGQHTEFHPNRYLNFRSFFPSYNGDLEQRQGRPNWYQNVEHSDPYHYAKFERNQSVGLYENKLMLKHGRYEQIWLNSLRAMSNISFCHTICLFVGCFASQQHVSVSQGRICLDSSPCCHTEIEVADQTFYFTQSQYTDTGPTSPSTDPALAWQGNHWSANFWLDPEKSRRKRDSNPGSSTLEADALPLDQRGGLPHKMARQTWLFT